MSQDQLDGLPRYIDLDGHAIPITGRRCRICTYPLHPAIRLDTHPTCMRQPTPAPTTY